MCITCTLYFHQVTVGVTAAIFHLNESLGLGNTATISYQGTLDTQYYIEHSSEGVILDTVTEYVNVEHDTTWAMVSETT